MFVRRFYSFYKNSTGQSISEYTLLITLVIVAVYVMMPYVIRSWNASVKGWEDSVTDSRQDPLAQSVAITDTECHCYYKKPCTSAPCCGYGECTQVESTKIYVCDPVGCDTRLPDQCVPTKGCCTPAIPLSAPAHCGTRGCAATEVPAFYKCGTERSNTPKHKTCQFNRNCSFRCLNPPNVEDPAYTKEGCPRDDLNLVANTAITFVKHGECGMPQGSVPKCQWECAPGFVPGKDGHSCVCPTNYVKQGDQCVLFYIARVRGDCYSDTPDLDQIDGEPGCRRYGCMETECDFEHKTLFSVGDIPNIMPDAFNFQDPEKWTVTWSGDQCDLVTGLAGNWCRMSGPGTWTVTADITYNPTGDTKSITMTGTDRMKFQCGRPCP